MMNQNFNKKLQKGLIAEKHFYNLFIENNILAYISDNQSEIGDIWLPRLKSNIGTGFYLELKTKVKRVAYPDTGFNCNVAKNYYDNLLNGNDTLIVFIDKENGIYGNFASNLFGTFSTGFYSAKNIKQPTSYPRCEEGIVFFHMESFCNIEYIKKYLSLNNLQEEQLIKKIKGEMI